MDWDDFRYILALSRAKTLSEAAQQLGVVRTTVGRRIEAIEASMGVRLFNRSSEGFIPTASGQELADAAAQIEAQALAAQGRVLGHDARLSGKLRVSMLDFIYQGYVEVVSSFLARYPDIELTVSTTYEEVSLRRREADVVLRLNNTPSEHLVAAKRAQSSKHEIVDVRLRVANVVNTGHALQVGVDRATTLKVKGRDYALLQFHFHTPSEHKLEHKGYPMEMHLVHQDAEGHIAVVGVLFEEGQENPWLTRLWADLPRTAGAKVKEDFRIRVHDLVHLRDHALHYDGSLTTPPCSEGVDWFVLGKPQQASREQIETIHGITGDNARPIQPRGERVIERE